LLSAEVDTRLEAKSDSGDQHGVRLIRTAAATTAACGLQRAESLLLPEVVTPREGLAYRRTNVRSVPPVPRTDRFFAAICRSGHLVDAFVVNVDELLGWKPGSGGGTLQPVDQYCGKCGAPVLLRCPNCSAPLLGQYRSYATPVKPEQFCRGCGSAYPWASREARIAHLSDQLAHDIEDENDRLEAAEALRVLTAPSDQATLPDRKRAAEKLRQLATQAWFGVASPVLSGLLSAELRKQLGLPSG
jgi:hypothetical protein